ncbi:MAG: hypothetical protein ACYTGB_05520 [Planctomycetota bacterium]|jgi:NAD-dependent dihydropyrimidine dehydrogenase PreA subunit
MGTCTVAISAPESGGLAELLAGRGWDVVELPDVYGLRPGAAALEALGGDGPLVLFSRLRPRAAFWTLRALGLEGRRVETLAGEAGEAAGDGGRPVLCLDLSVDGSAENSARRLEEFAPPPPAGRTGEVLRPEAEAEERWYPVVDYDRCENCGDCMEFCLFGVYDVDGDERVVAADPDACKPGCPACSRVCPRGAIMFPLHASEPAIAGADEGTIEPLDAANIRRDLAASPRAQITAEEIARICRCAPGAAEAAAAGAQLCDCACDCTPDASAPAGAKAQACCPPTDPECPCCGGDAAGGENRECFDDLVRDLAEE